MPKKIIYATTLRQRSRIYQSILHINNELDNKIRLTELCEISGYSPFHFQRLFSNLTGETWPEYLVRSRLFLAAQRLINTSEKISDISYLAGFDTPVGFNKAFKKCFASTPSYYRSEYIGEDYPNLAIPRKHKRHSYITPSIQWLDQYHAIYTTEEGNLNGEFDSAIWQAMSKLSNLIFQHQYLAPHINTWIGSVEPREFFSGKNAKCTIATPIPKHLVTRDLKSHIKVFPEGFYAVVPHQGAFCEQSMQCVVFDWLAQSQFDLDWHKPLFYHIKSLSFNNVAAMLKGKQHHNSQLFYQSAEMQLLEIENVFMDVYVPIVCKNNEKLDILQRSVLG